VRPPSAAIRAFGVSLLLALGLASSMLACGGQKRLTGSTATGGAGGSPDEPDAAGIPGGGSGGTGGSAGSGGTGNGDTAATPDGAGGAVEGGSVGSDSSAGTTSDAATPTSDGSPPAGCKLPDGLPLKGRPLPNVPGSQDLVFDREGNVVTVERRTRDLQATPYEGVPVTWAAGITRDAVFSTAFVPDGTLVIATTSSLLGFDAQKNKRTLATNLDYAHGLAIDRQGRIYFSTKTSIQRLEGAGPPTIVSKDARFQGGLAFSPGYDTLYVTGDAGEVRKMSVGADGQLGPQQRLGVVPKEANLDVILFDIAVDECGNLYVSQGNHQVWRMTPTGDTTKIFDINSAVMGVRFGSGRGGWKATSLYVSTLQGPAATAAVMELDLGVRGMGDPYLGTP
jgi:sugar lactone lactonase YvrE